MTDNEDMKKIRDDIIIPHLDDAIDATLWEHYEDALELIKVAEAHIYTILRKLYFPSGA